MGQVEIRGPLRTGTPASQHRRQLRPHPQDAAGYLAMAAGVSDRLWEIRRHCEAGRGCRGSPGETGRTRSWLITGEGMKHQLTGNAGMYHVARELSRLGWHVMPTVRNARGADLYAVGEDEQNVRAIQSKAPIEENVSAVRRIIGQSSFPLVDYYLDANTRSPICYIMTLDEVKAAAYEGKTGAASYWLEAKSYMRDEYEEKWERLGSPTSAISA